MSDIEGGQKSVFSSFLADFSARRARSMVGPFSLVSQVPGTLLMHPLTILDLEKSPTFIE